MGVLVNWETLIRWCYVHEVSAVEDLDHCWKEQWFKDQGELIWRRCRIIEGRLHIESAAIQQVGLL